MQSCEPENPDFVRKLNTEAQLQNRELSVNEPGCPEAGNNCKRTFAGSRQQRLNEFDIFKRYYDNKDLASYFDLHKDYELILPGIDRTDLISKILHGDYLVSILANKCIVVYKSEDNKPFNYSNLVFAFDPNLTEEKQ